MDVKCIFGTCKQTQQWGVRDEVDVGVWCRMTENGSSRQSDVGCSGVVLWRDVQNQCGAGSLFWKRTEEPWSLLDVSVGRHIAQAKPSIR